MTSCRQDHEAIRFPENGSRLPALQRRGRPVMERGSGQHGGAQWSSFAAGKRTELTAPYRRLLLRLELLARNIPFTLLLCLLLVGYSDLSPHHSLSCHRLVPQPSAYCRLSLCAPCCKVLFLRGGGSSTDDFSLSDYVERRPGQSSWGESDAKESGASKSQESASSNETKAESEDEASMVASSKKKKTGIESQQIQPDRPLPTEPPPPRKEEVNTVKAQGEFTWQRRGREKEKKLDELMMESSVYESEAKTYGNDAIAAELSNASDVLLNMNEYAGKSLMTDMKHSVKSLDSYQGDLLARTKYPGKHRQDAVLDELIESSSTASEALEQRKEKEEEAEGDIEASVPAPPSSEASVQPPREEGTHQVQEDERQYSDDIGGAGFVVRPWYNVLKEEERKRKAKRARSKTKIEEEEKEEEKIQFEPIPKGKVRLPDGSLRTYFCPYLEDGYNELLTEDAINEFLREKNESTGGKMRG
eukprot:763408-Hanusia_phi.AAC.3